MSSELTNDQLGELIKGLSDAMSKQSDAMSKQNDDLSRQHLDTSRKLDNLIDRVSNLAEKMEAVVVKPVVTPVEAFLTVRVVRLEEQVSVLSSASYSLEKKVELLSERAKLSETGCPVVDDSTTSTPMSSISDSGSRTMVMPVVDTSNMGDDLFASVVIDDSENNASDSLDTLVMPVVEPISKFDDSSVSVNLSPFDHNMGDCLVDDNHQDSSGVYHYYHDSGDVSNHCGSISDDSVDVSGLPAVD